MGNDELGVHEDTQLYGTAIREGVQPYADITVFDHYKPEQLKEEYNKAELRQPTHQW